jgi:D-aspartate ligase
MLYSKTVICASKWQQTKCEVFDPFRQTVKQVDSHLSLVQQRIGPEFVPTFNPSFHDSQLLGRSTNGSLVGGLVIGGDFQGLGVVRSLGLQGIPVGILDDEISIARFSRYATFSERVSSLMDPDEAVRCILEVGRKRGLQGWVLFPTRDETVATISRHREELTKVFRVPTPGWETVQWLWDKRKTYALAERLGIPVPRTWYPKSAEDLDQIEGYFPVAIKPAIKEHFIYATGVKALRADNLTQLRELYKRTVHFMPADEIMIQDVVPGGGNTQYSFCSLFKKGRSVATLVTCRRRQHPLEFGRSSTYVESVELPLLEKYSEEFLHAIDYYGLVELEYKYDARDGQYRLLDVNGRTWGYHTIGRSAGVDYPYLLFEDQLDRPSEPMRGKAGIRWIRLVTDLPTGVLGIASGKIPLKSYVRSLCEFDEEAVFSLEDPMPGFAEIALIPYLAIRRGF